MAAGTWSAPPAEGIAAQVTALTELVATRPGQPLTRLRVDGGLTRSTVLMQAQADLARIPSTCIRRRTPPLWGGGVRAARSGPGPAVPDTVSSWTPQHTYEPALVGRARRRLPGPLARPPPKPPSPRRIHRQSAGPMASAFRRRRDRRGLVGARSLAHWPVPRFGDAGRGPHDVGDGTSKANTAFLHTGFDATPGTLESRLVARGYDLLAHYAEQTGIPVERTGAMLVAWTEEESDALPSR